MGLHADWKAVKSKAKTLNKNIEIKFPSNMHLGPALDKLEAAEKVYKKAAMGEHNAVWAKAADAYFKLAREAGKAALTYVQALPRMPIDDQARSKLDTYLTMVIMDKAKDIVADAKRLEPKLAKARK